MTNSNRWSSFALVSSLIALLAVVAFGAGLLVERELQENKTVASTTDSGSLATDRDGNPETFDRFEEVKALIGDEYFGIPDDDKSEAEFWNDLENKAIEGMVGGLDGFSTYLEPVQTDDFSQQMDGEFEGIGVWIASQENQPVIVSAVAGSPAEEAGLKSGDVLISADGTELSGLSDEQILDLVRGPAGTSVHLEIQREGESAPLDFDVERRKMTIPVVQFSMVDGTNYALISLAMFADHTTEQLDKAIASAQAAGAEGIILDLRGNGGGWVQSARETIGRFVKSDAGPALIEQSEVDDQIQTDTLSILEADQVETALPLVVLIDNGSASSSEIVAGALQDYDRATIVGQTSFGKGSVQRLHDFDDGSSLRLTVAHWLTPNGRAIDHTGITPDLVVEPAESSGSSDPYIQAAIDVFQGVAATPAAA